MPKETPASHQCLVRKLVVIFVTQQTKMLVNFVAISQAGNFPLRGFPHLGGEKLMDGHGQIRARKMKKL